MAIPELHLAYVDGACSGNPGPMGIGGVIYSPDGRVLFELSDSKGPGTNNQAEYLALIAVLEAARRHGVSAIEIRSDSELLVRQVNGIYKVKHEGIRPLYEQATRLLGLFDDYRVVHIRREQNKEADRLSKAGLEKTAVSGA
ncbi:MAG TPA: ribonuclease HI family protein [Dehalococcoidia bacterium]|nr:ribonuclease HI family protein [Dehalococcoidia bacterium]